jgi:hypothetical protein
MKARRNNKIYTFSVIGSLDGEGFANNKKIKADSIEEVIKNIEKSFNFKITEKGLINAPNPETVWVWGWCIDNNLSLVRPFALEISKTDEN